MCARQFGFPANHYLVFVIFGVVMFSSIFMTALLPKSINRQKIEKEKKKQEEEEEKEDEVEDEKEEEKNKVEEIKEMEVKM